MSDLVEAEEAAATTAVPEPIEEPPQDVPATLEEYIREELSYPEERRVKLQNFFKKREKNLETYTYTADGDLLIKESKRGGEEILPLKTYVPYDTATWEKRDQNRLDTIAMAETKYEEALQGLRDALENYKLTGAKQPVIAAQAEVTAADAVLSRVRYGARGIALLPNPEVRQVMFDKPYETRRLFPNRGDPFKKAFARLIVREYPYHTFYGSYVESSTVPPEALDADAVMDQAPEGSEASVRQRLKDGRTARIFFDADEGPNGFLSPFWPVEFTLGGTGYFTAYQAYEAERAKEVGQEELRLKILATRSARTIRFLMKKIAMQPKDPKGLWLRIATSVFQQHPELKERLLATGTDALVFADSLANPSGIGLAPTATGILDPSKWRGENALGVALETVRMQMREGTAAEAPVNTALQEKVITEEEQEKAKVGAIIATKKKFAFKRPAQ